MRGQENYSPRAAEARGVKSLKNGRHGCGGALAKPGWISLVSCCAYEAFVTFAAWGPFWPSVISNSTGSPSCRLL